MSVWRTNLSLTKISQCECDGVASGTTIDGEGVWLDGEGVWLAMAYPRGECGVHVSHQLWVVSVRAAPGLARRELEGGRN